MRVVYIIDSHYPEDYFAENADGPIAQQILKALSVRADLRIALDREHFRKAVTRATKAECDVLHIAGHGDDDGIALCIDPTRTQEGLRWADFVAMFQGPYPPPKVLVMSACRGASSELGRAFSAVAKRPMMIIGSTDERYPADYVAAWALLYRRLKRKGMDIDAAQQVLEDICAVVHKNFRYLRWDEERERYLRYPGTGRRFDVVERE
jgi:hypothetical protein